MGSRCGDIDYSIIPYIMKETGMSLEEVDKILNKKSGMLGISGISSDFRDIEAQISNGNHKAILAHHLLVNSIVKYIAQYYVELDEEANNVRGEFKLITKEGSKIPCYIVPTDEEVMIARDTYSFLNN